MFKKLTAINSITHKPQLWFSVVLLGLVFLFAYQEIILRTVKGWLNFEQSYGLLIFCICLYMIWIKKDQILNTERKPSPIFGLPIVFTGAVLLLFAKLSNTLMFQGISMVIVLLGIVAAVIGFQQFKIFLIPIGYLIFMFSLIEELLGFLSKGLQLLTAKIAAFLLSIAGMPVFLHSEIIRLPHITLEVAKVCNGVNHIVALVALAIPMAVISTMSIPKKIIFIFFAFFVGLLANGIRVALIGWWTIKYSEASIHGPFELFYASFILFFGLCIVFIVRLFFSKRISSSQREADIINKNFSFVSGTPNLRLISIVGSAVILAAAIGYSSITYASKGELIFPIEGIPLRLDRFAGHDVSDKDWPFKGITGDQVLKRIYFDEDSGDHIGLFVSYFENQNQDKELINHRLMWLHYRATLEKLTIDDREIALSRGLPRGMESQSYEGDSRVFYFFYYINGKVLTNPYDTKFALLINALFNRKSDGAFVVFVTEKSFSGKIADEDNLKNFIGAAYPILIQRLNTR